MPPFESLKFAWIEAGANIRRSGRYILSTLAVLIPITCTEGLLLLHQSDLSRMLSQRTLTINAYLSPGVSPYKVNLLKGDIARLPGVREVRFIPKDEAWEELRDAVGLGRELEGYFQDSPLPDSFSIRVSPGEARSVAEQTRTLKGVQEVELLEEDLDAAAREGGSRSPLILLVGGSLAAAAALIISLSLRMRLRAAAREHQILYLLGASRGFITLPLIVEGAVLGLLSTAIGLIFAYLIYRNLPFGSAPFQMMGDAAAGMASPTLFQAGLYLLGGVLLGAGGGVISTWRLRGPGDR